ncbi:acyl-CoA dehydrogenase family protein [Mycobacterium sp. SMC-4]|uniref:acyl-CoA dehydrogenase family protein n=1 Tax=Mycobacterium sp. SMC-4 TaxID=2857059 RepID=UPI0021B20E8E|nr:acyl-CoA dehydrogenase family protein [Mycobacterium sp. SMC-4]UXA20849.1 acyl-CoA/acyl-ACP dehydrogenase [Mycobacterium sp. SMC-4]
MMDAVLRQHGRNSDPADLWNRLADLGLVRLTGAETSSGSGAGWREAAALMSAAVHNGVRLPLAEHDLLACWLLDAAGVTGYDGVMRTVCVLDADGRARAVPWASRARRVVTVTAHGDGFTVADRDVAELSITPGVNMIGEPRDTVAAHQDAPEVGISAALVAQLRNKAALVRAVQVCAALDCALESSITHATSREQFGRPLAKFQVVQHLIADMASEAALARSATDAAIATGVASDWAAPNLDFLVAVARSCAGHAASVVVRHAHQVHGAIGTTKEHRLHEFTRAALAWRSEFGTVRDFDEQLTRLAVDAGAGSLWQTICP